MNYLGLIAIKLAAYGGGPMRIRDNDEGDPLTFPQGAGVVGLTFLFFNQDISATTGWGAVVHCTCCRHDMLPKKEQGLLIFPITFAVDLCYFMCVN